jgi:hypothetical protein
MNNVASSAQETEENEGVVRVMDSYSWKKEQDDTASCDKTGAKLFLGRLSPGDGEQCGAIGRNIIVQHHRQS